MFRASGRCMCKATGTTDRYLGRMSSDTREMILNQTAKELPHAKAVFLGGVVAFCGLTYMVFRKPVNKRENDYLGNFEATK